MMRDPNRLDNIYNTLLTLHKESIPDWRVGQLLINFLSWYYERYQTDYFYIEDHEFINRFKIFIETL